MLPVEKELFEKLMEGVDGSDKKLNLSLDGREEKSKNELVVFKENVEEFLGMDGEKMGGFDKGQMANIPKEIAKILVDSGKAELVYD